MSITVNTQYNSRSPYQGVKPEVQKVPSVEHAPKTEQKTVQSKWLKPAALISATAGLALSLAYIAKKQNIKLIEKNEFTDIFKPKNWKLMNLMKLDYKTKEVFMMGASSTIGGLVAGLAFDVKNEKAKVREGLQQMVGNLVIPIGFVEGVRYLFDKNDKHIPIKNQNIKNMLKIGSALGALGVGMLVGNKVANEINEHLLGAKQDRPLKVSDLAGQIDDVCLATLLVAPKNQLLQKVSQIIPLALIVPGYETGVKKLNYNEK